MTQDPNTTDGGTEDPHAALHEQAATDSQQDEPVAAGDGDDWKAELAKINKALTARINNLRTDCDTFQKNVSTSVKAVQGDITSLKTATENNKASIEAQDEVIKLAGEKADKAKTAADGAAKAAGDASKKASEVDGKVGALTTAYERHTHALTLSVQGETTPPQPAGETAQGGR